MATSTAAVGRSIPRLEAHAKVTGRAEYVHNLRVPGMLIRSEEHTSELQSH